MKRLAALAGLLLLAASAAAQEESGPAPLFASDEPLEVTLDGPIRTIVRNAERSTDPHQATLMAADETHAIELSARGLSRRKEENCRFPPLMVRFAAKPADASLFDRQRSLKLVTHCNDNDRAEQHVLREYAAYRLYNLLTPKSLRVRLLRLTYVDDGRVIASRPGFLIEDIDDAADRLGGTEIDIASVPRESVDPADAARYQLFQYMIGNTDWAMRQGPPGTDCCHNSKLVGSSKEARSGLIPIPYDFDNSGFVDAPYAVPNALLPIRSVAQRHYRGYCTLNALVAQAVPEFRARRAAFEAELAAVPGMTDGTRRDVQRYIASFYDDVASPRDIERKLFSDCR